MSRSGACGFQAGLLMGASRRSQLRSVMSGLTFGVVAGLVFGTLAVAAMLPLAFPDKRAALTAAFVDRFAIGFVLGLVSLPWPGWVVGLVIGLLLSAPSAIITKAWKPILAFGAVGGLVIGLIRTAVVRGQPPWAPETGLYAPKQDATHDCQRRGLPRRDRRSATATGREGIGCPAQEGHRGDPGDVGHEHRRLWADDVSREDRNGRLVSSRLLLA